MSLIRVAMNRLARQEKLKLARAIEEEISRLTAEVKELNDKYINEASAYDAQMAYEHEAQDKIERLTAEVEQMKDMYVEVRVERDALRAALQEIVDHYPDDGEPPPYIYGRLQLQEIAEAALTASAVVKDSPTLPRNGPLDALKTTEPTKDTKPSALACPNCGGPVEKVRQDLDKSSLNADQFDAIRAGDYYCEACPDNGRGKSKLCYWWKHELKTTEG